MSDPIWAKYNEAKELKPPRPILVKTIEKFESSFTGNALDVGCGAGNDAYELLRRGWHVTCLDMDDFSIKKIKGFEAELPGKVKALEEEFEKVKCS